MNFYIHKILCLNSLALIIYSCLSLESTEKKHTYFHILDVGASVYMSEQVKEEWG